MISRARASARRWSRLPLALGLAVQWSCSSGSGYGFNASSPYLMVLPQVVQLRAPSSGTISFRLEAIATDASGQSTSTGTLTWTSNPVGATFVSTGAETIVTLPLSIAPGDVIRLNATNGTDDGYALVLVTSPPAQVNDEVRAEIVVDDDPTLLLHSGAVGSGCSSDLLRAFVGSAPLGNWTSDGACDRYEGDVFSVSRRPLLVQPMPWTTGQDVVDASAAEKAYQLPLKVIFSVPTADRAAAVSELNGSLLLAEGVFHDMRIGISFPPMLTTKIFADNFELRTCEQVALLEQTLLPDPAALNVYVLKSLADWPYRGLFCPPNVLLVWRGLAVGTTLVHEFGHALGLTAPWWGHVDNVFGFSTDNVMSATAGSGSGYAERTRLTLGQAYRMHVDGRSWLKRSPDLSDGPNICPCDPYLATKCPPLRTDVRPMPSATPPPLPEAACP